MNNFVLVFDRSTWLILPLWFRHVISFHQQNHVTSNEEVRSEQKNHEKVICVSVKGSDMIHTEALLCLNLLLFLHVVAELRQQQWPVPYR